MLIFLLFTPPALCAEETESKKIIFTWAFLYADNNTIKPIDYEEPTQVLPAGSRIKVYMKPVENVYIYLLQKNPEGGLILLFPQNFKHFKDYYKPGKDYYIPPGTDWLHLNTLQRDSIETDSNTGASSQIDSPVLKEETFYFIASRGRLIKLESLIKKYFSSDENPGNEKAEAVQAVIEHIKKLRLEYSSFRPEKQEIVLIAGEFRGPENGFEFPALDITADTFYAKTIRITY